MIVIAKFFLPSLVLIHSINPASFSLPVFTEANFFGNLLPPILTQTELYLCLPEFGILGLILLIWTLFPISYFTQGTPRRLTGLYRLIVGSAIFFNFIAFLILVRYAAYFWTEEIDDIFVWEDSLVISYDSLLLKTVVLFIGILVLIFMAVDLQAELGARKLGVFLLVCTLVPCFILLASVADLYPMFIIIEVVSLISYALPTIDSQLNAGISTLYFTQGAFASALLLTGSIWITGGLQETNFDVIGRRLIAGDCNTVTILGVALIFVSLLFKVAVFPGYLWSIHVYQSLSFKLLIILTVLAKCGLMVIIINFFFVSLPWVYEYYAPVIFVSSVISILIGFAGALAEVLNRGQSSIKRLLAFAGINQLGYVLIGFAFVRYSGLFVAAGYYLVAYLVGSFIFISSLNFLRYKNKPVESLDDLGGLLGYSVRISDGWSRFHYRCNVGVIIFSVWSIAGLPPFAGFFTKYALWENLYQLVVTLVESATDPLLNSEPFNICQSAESARVNMLVLLFISVFVSIGSLYYYFVILEKVIGVPESEISFTFNYQGYILLYTNIVLLIALVYWGFWIAESVTTSHLCEIFFNR